MDDIVLNVENISEDSLNDLQKDKKFFRTGAFGSVERAVFCGKVVAIKYFRNHDHYKKNMQELVQLASCDSENIVKVFGAGPQLSEGKINFYVMEFADTGSLDYVLHKINPKIKYTLAQAINWALQCAKAVAYLHDRDQPIIHRDVKPGNLLLFDNGRRVKLCDFGTTKIAHTENTAECGTYLYMAPEVMMCINERRKAKYDERCDVFSWTIIFWELLTRRKPYEKLASVISIVSFVCMDKKHLDDIPNCPPVIKQLIDRGWNYEVRMRPKMRTIVEIMSIIADEIPGVYAPLKLPKLFEDMVPSPCPSRPPSCDRARTPQTNVEIHLDPPQESFIDPDIRAAYIADKPDFKSIEAIPNDDESTKLFRQQESLLEEYVKLRYDCDHLYQRDHDLVNDMTSVEEERIRIHSYCGCKLELEYSHQIPNEQ